MAKIIRATQTQFGLTGPSGDFGEFGSLAAATPNYTKDPAVIQDLAAWLTGWAAATLANNRPALEDMNSLFYLAYYQICYLLQAGIPEWDAGTTYYTNSFVQVSGVIYKSLLDDNLNKDPASQPTWWSASIIDDTTYVKTSGAQAVNGVKTFGSFPVTPSSAPTTDYQVANKKYADDKVAAITKAALGIDSGKATANSGTTAVSFNFTFTTTPVVTATPVDSALDLFFRIANVTTTGFSVVCNQNCTAHWIAVGTKA